jgi:hypothetical protein
MNRGRPLSQPLWHQAAVGRTSAPGRYCCKSILGHGARNIDSSEAFKREGWFKALSVAERKLRRQSIQPTFATLSVDNGRLAMSASLHCSPESRQAAPGHQGGTAPMPAVQVMLVSSRKRTLSRYVRSTDMCHNSGHSSIGRHWPSWRREGRFPVQTRRRYVPVRRPQAADRSVNCAAGEKMRRRRSSVATNPVMPEATRIIATMMNW